MVIDDFYLFFTRSFSKHSDLQINKTQIIFFLIVNNS
nr:MAG TPA: hypothetical protein [Caudoviricetes sp.]